MLSKYENAMRILKFENPEYIMGSIPANWLLYYGCNHESFDGVNDDCPVGTKWTDIWGTGWLKELPDIMGFPRHNPLAEIKDYKNYKWPDPDDERICGQIYKSKEWYPDGGPLYAGSHRDTLWEKSYMLVGMENMMIYLYTEPEYAKEILHRIMDFQIGIAKHYIKAGVNMIGMSDDLGTQRNLLIGLDTLYEFFVPEYKRLFEFYKEQSAIIEFHSCGHIEPVLGMFMELGVNVLGPLQASANNLKNVRKITQGKMALMGGVSSKTIMDGPVEAIDEEVKNTIRLLGKNGGYFCGPDQWMPYSEENLNAFNKSVEKHGKYPL